jgi:hypothetical protein
MKDSLVICNGRLTCSSTRCRFAYSFYLSHRFGKVIPYPWERKYEAAPTVTIYCEDRPSRGDRNTVFTLIPFELFTRRLQTMDSR